MGGGVGWVFGVALWVLDGGGTGGVGRMACAVGGKRGSACGACFESGE